jgi:hypothetical protein
VVVFDVAVEVTVPTEYDTDAVLSMVVPAGIPTANASSDANTAYRASAVTAATVRTEAKIGYSSKRKTRDRLRGERQVHDSMEFGALLRGIIGIEGLRPRD